MSLVMGIMGGVGDAGGNFLREEQRNNNQMGLLMLHQELEKNKLMFAKDLADKSRVDEAARVGKAKQGIVGKTLDQEDKDAGISDVVTPQQQAAVDKNRDSRRQELMNDPEIHKQAGLETGDLTTKDVALLNQKEVTTNGLLAGVLARTGSAEKRNENTTASKERIAAEGNKTKKELGAGHDATELEKARIAAEARIKSIGAKASVAGLKPIEYLKETRLSINQDRAALQKESDGIDTLPPKQRPAAREKLKIDARREVLRQREADWQLDNSAIRSNPGYGLPKKEANTADPLGLGIGSP